MPQKLPTRKLGNDQVSTMGFGTMGLSAYYGTPLPDEERLQLLDAVYDSGCLLWDTADVYGDSEELLGKWFKRTGKRQDIFLATKFGLASGKKFVCGDPEYVPEALNKSLSRLGVDKVDLYYLHRPDPEVPIELTIRAMSQLVKAGKVKYLGLSECSENCLRRAHAVHPITAVQVEYSPITTDIENPNINVLNACRELGVHIVAYAPLGRGVLTGRFKSPDEFPEGDFRRTIPRYSKENFPNILKLVDEIKAIASRHNATPSQVVIAWVLAQGDDFIPIPGSTKVQNFKENLGALNVTLSKDEIEEIRGLVNKINIGHMDRYDPTFAALLFCDTPPLNK